MAEGMVQIVRLSSYKPIFIGLLFILLGACGTGDGTNPNVVTPQPVLMAALPPQAAPGDTVVLQGVGFSIVPNNNIVILDDVSSQALTHRFLDQLPLNGATEEITFQIPVNTLPGATPLFLLVEEQPSNSLPFTVESP